MCFQEISKVLQDEKLALRYFSRQILIVFGVLGSDTPKLKKKWRLAVSIFCHPNLIKPHPPPTPPGN
ncbi:hypothetical protein EON63_14595 [archaeon]|nr:MAG: hypothetical protein EON63_14595 [archaeon]